jgi:isocitrate/isopropylmalate dehydrogenase
MFIFPGHTSQPIPFDDKIIASTIDEVKKRVKLLNVPQHEFVDTLVQKIPAPPPNYLAIVEKNLSGDVLGADASELEAGANRCAVS